MKTMRLLIVVLGVLWLPNLAAAQSASTGAIAGIVRDATGAVLPGVTVEVSSPSLTQIRTAVTDATGQYKLVDLAIGTYTVAFTLPGFSTTERKGVELSAGFTAPVNAEMRIGAVEETVTVQAASPVVDIQSVRTQSVLKRETLDALPGGKNFASLVSLTVGA